MSEPKVIWSGTYAGIDADVRVVNGKPVPFLTGRTTAFMHHAEGVLGAAVMGLAIERDVLLERLTRIEKPAQQLVNIDNDLAEGRDVAAKASFHDSVMRPIEELRGYFGNVARAEKREQTIFDVEADRRKRAERERDELRERLVKLEAGLATACNEWEYASQYKGEFLAEKHGDAEDIAELRELLKGTGDVET